MTYKLIKELKDAGFPSLLNVPDEYLVSNEPGLSELIEAIGATGRTLEMHQYSDKSGWMASVDKHTWTSDKELDVALGHLFLELNKK